MPKRVPKTESFPLRTIVTAVLVVVLAAFHPATPYALQSDGVWSSPDRVPERERHACIFDPIRDRFIAFGGLSTLGLLRDVWAYDVHDGRWSELHPAGEPPPGDQYYMGFYAPRSGEMIIVNTQRADVWALSLGDAPSWRHLSPAAGTVPPQAYFSCALDPVRHRVVTFGGQMFGAHGASWNVDEIWLFDLTSLAWSRVPAAAGPEPRRLAVAAYDPDRNWLIIHGGSTYLGPIHHDVWAYSFMTNTWQNLDPTGTPYGGVTGRVMALDKRRARICIVGQPEGSLWCPTPGTPWAWVAVPALQTPSFPDWNPSVAYDSTGDRLLVLGKDGLHALMLSESSWRLIAPRTWNPMSPISQSATAFDPIRHRVVAYGGAGPPYSVELYTPTTLDLGVPPVWGSIEAEGPSPSPRRGSLMIYDSIRDRMIVENGLEQASLTVEPAPMWSTVRVSGRPEFQEFEQTTIFGPFTECSGGIYDPARDRLVVTAARKQSSGLGVNEVWTLPYSNASVWTREVASIPRPNVLSTGRAVYDAESDRMLCLVQHRFFDGITNHDTIQVWALPLEGPGSWMPVSPPAPFGASIAGGSMILDPIRRRLVIYGGIVCDPCALSGEIWSLDLSGPTTWRLLSPAGAPPAARTYHNCIYDPIGDRMVIFGGRESNVGPDFSDTWFLTWGDSSAAILGRSADSTWMPSRTAPLRFPVTNRGPGSRSYRYVLTDERQWPGFPIVGTINAGPGSQLLTIDVPAPDSALFGTNHLLLRIHPVEYPGLVTTSNATLRSAATQVSAVLVSAAPDSGGVALEWRLTGGVAPEVDIERAEGSGDWTRLAHVLPESGGRVAFLDRDAQPGGHYRYRLVTHDLTGDRTFDEVAVEVPFGSWARFALAGARPNPASASLAISFSLPDAAPAALELLDLSGRRVRRMEIGAMGQGPHLVQLGAGLSLRSGVYFVRMTRGPQHATARVVLIE